MIRLRSRFTFIAYVPKESEARRRGHGETGVPRWEQRAAASTAFRKT